jgi:hypothetical protein
MRELLWAGIAILLLYGAWQLLRALAAGRRRAQEASPPARRAAPTAEESEADDEDDEDGFEGGFDYAPIARPLTPPAPAAGTAPSAAPTPAPAPAGPDAFQLELELQRMRREVAGLRAALDVQQGEIGGLHESVRLLREQLESAAAAPAGAPQYTEALVFARRGLPAELIAERCDISVAEAELVRSLAARGEDAQR